MKRRQEAAEEAERLRLQAEAGKICLHFIVEQTSITSSISIADQRAKEEDAIRQAEAANRDQADAGTPSREEAGKCPPSTRFQCLRKLLSPMLSEILKKSSKFSPFSYTLRIKINKIPKNLLNW